MTKELDNALETASWIMAIETIRGKDDPRLIQKREKLELSLSKMDKDDAAIFRASMDRVKVGGMAYGRAGI